jgi:hypothetical protein
MSLCIAGEYEDSGDGGPLLDETSNLKTELLELPQCLGVAPGIIHGIVGVRGDSIILPFRCFGSVLDQAGVKVTDPPA